MLRFNRVLVDEKGLVVPATAVCANPSPVVVVDFLKESPHTAGREADADEIGILKTFARLARTGESGRIVGR